MICAVLTTEVIAGRLTYGVRCLRTGTRWWWPAAEWRAAIERMERLRLREAQRVEGAPARREMACP